MTELFQMCAEDSSKQVLVDGKHTTVLERIKVIMSDTVPKDTCRADGKHLLEVAVESSAVNKPTIMWLSRHGVPITNAAIQAAGPGSDIAKMLEKKRMAAKTGTGAKASDQPSSSDALAKEPPAKRQRACHLLNEPAEAPPPNQSQTSSDRWHYDLQIPCESSIKSDYQVAVRDASTRQTHMTYEEKYKFIVLERLMSAWTDLQRNLDERDKCDDTPRDWAVWPPVAIIEVKGERGDLTTAALRQAKEKYADPAQARHRRDMERHLEWVERTNVVQSVDAVNVGKSHSPAFNVQSKLFDGEVDAGRHFQSIEGTQARMNV